MSVALPIGPAFSVARTFAGYVCRLCTDFVEHRHRNGQLCRECRRGHRQRAAAAHIAVAKAIYRGELARPATLACADCGRPAQQYDHRDYSLPLVVDPVCRSCNCKRGPAP